MTRSTVVTLSLLVAVSVLGGCAPKCQAVQHIVAATNADTTAIDPDGQTCSVHIYSATALDSVGPKPK